MSGWAFSSISDVCEKVVSGGTPLTSRQDYYENGVIPWLKTREINQCRIYSTENHITQLGLENSSAKLLPINTVTIAMYGDGQTAGRVGLTKIPLATNQACCNLIVDKSIAEPDFVFYFLLDSYAELVAMKSGSGQQNLNTRVIKAFQMPVPCLNEQRAIAALLGCLDDKIELLHRQNKTIEDMTETLFHQWFTIDFHGDWKERSLSDVANFLNGLACQKYPPISDLDKLPVLKIRELSNGISESVDWASSRVRPEYIVETGDVIFAWSASLMVKVWDGPKCVLNQHLFKVTSEEFPKWFYLRWCKHHLLKFVSVAANHATTMGHIKRSDLDSAKVIVPPQAALEMMSKVMRPLLEKQIAIAKQRRTLQQLRDILLPKLMSGEVRVAY